jgi:chromosome segregation ATPase
MMVESAHTVIAIALVLVLGGLLSAAWRDRGRSLKAIRAERARLKAELAHKESSLARTLERCDELQADLDAVTEKLGQDETRIEQLRDLIKVHVARRREFDEWANPIRVSLGESFGHTLRALKEQVARQEFALSRQERIVADAEAQYRGKQDELERMRRELALKNYHIAALNERFIRVEERMQDLALQVSAIGLGRAPAGASAARTATEGFPASPETERFTPETGESRDWMEVLDNWHRQLHERLDRMDELQARLRAGAPRTGGLHHPGSGRAGEAGA